MSIVRRIFPSDTDALRPRLACEITPAGVLAARPGSVAEAGEAQDVVTQFAPLRLGVLVPGLKTPAMTDRAAISSASARPAASWWSTISSSAAATC